MSEWQKICELKEIKEGEAAYRILNKHPLAIAIDKEGKVRVTDDTCPHAGASLSAGYMEDDCLVCGWHHWAFSIKDGKCIDNDEIGVKCYPVKIEDEDVYIQWPETG